MNTTYHIEAPTYDIFKKKLDALVNSEDPVLCGGVSIEWKPTPVNAFVAELIEVFEIFLDSKGIKLDNPEKDEAIMDGQPAEEVANIYGTDYGNIQSDLEVTLRNHGILKEENGQYSFAI